ncbi:MAG TPA: SAM-dependent methyltransferase [Trebonia sp.]|nr:SAM-dependent methyltransferase [Trebonia sp.]
MALPFDTSVPSVARMYDVLLGGKDNFESDRAAVAKIVELEPEAPLVARRNRDYLRRAVRFLAVEAGVRQFLDVGSGLPSAGNVHEVAQEVAPAARVVYVDNDPVVLTHARALLTSSPEGACDYIDSDFRDTEAIISRAAKTLDFREPVAVMLLAILHFIGDKDDPWTTVARLMAAVPPGSYLVISHALSEDLTGNQLEGLNAVYAETKSGGVTQRSLPGIARFFEGLQLADPGLVEISTWRPEAVAQPPRALFYGGVGKKP